MLGDFPDWRCYSCFTIVHGWRIHCQACGSSNGNPHVKECKELYATAGFACTCAPVEPTKPAGELRDVNHVVIGFVILIVTILLGGALSSEETAAVDDMWCSAVMYSIVLIYAMINWRVIIKLLGPPRTRFYLSLIPFVAAPVTVGLAYMQLAVFPFLRDYWVNYSTNYLNEGFGWDTIFLMIAVGPAFFEELFFRGVMLSRLNKVMSDWQAIIVTAMAFAILHFAAIGLIFYLVPMAIVAGWLTLRTKSLWPAIALHLMHNGAVIYLEYIGFT